MLIKGFWIKICVCVFVAILLAAGHFWGTSQVSDRAPVLQINLIGTRELIVECGTEYKEFGATAQFTKEDSAESEMVPVAVTGNVDVQVLGKYLIKYTAKYGDYTGTSYRLVRVVDTQAPVIDLVANPGKYTFPNETYVEEGYAATDNYDGDLTHAVERTETKEIVTYTVTDSSGNITTVQRGIVYDDPIPPVLKLKGDQNITIWVGQKFKEPGYTASDNCDGDLTEKVQISGKVNSQKEGVYKLLYKVKDGYGNEVSAYREVRVEKKGASDQFFNDIVKPNGKVIYLTFDDGPSAYTPKLLEILRKYNVKATFFVVNTKYAHLIKQIAEEGHSVGIHSTTHDFKKIYASTDAYFKDLYKIQGIIKDLTGKETNLLRFPGGSSNTVSHFNPGIMTRLAKLVQDQGLRYFDWNVDSDDAGSAKNANEVYKNVINGIRKKQISVVLQHDTKGFSVNAVEDIIVWGLKNGYTFLPLDTTSPICHHNIKN